MSRCLTAAYSAQHTIPRARRPSSRPRRCAARALAGASQCSAQAVACQATERGCGAAARCIGCVLGSETPGTGRRAVGHLNKLLRAVLATQTQLFSHLHLCVHALAAKADFELPWWASRGPAVWAAAGIPSWRAFTFSGQLAACTCTVCSLGCRLHDASWGFKRPMRAEAVQQLVALRSKIVEQLPSGRPQNWGSWETVFFTTVIYIYIYIYEPEPIYIYLCTNNTDTEGWVPRTSLELPDTAHMPPLGQHTSHIVPHIAHKIHLSVAVASAAHDGRQRAASASRLATFFCS